MNIYIYTYICTLTWASRICGNLREVYGFFPLLGGEHVPELAHSRSALTRFPTCGITNILSPSKFMLSTKTSGRPL